MLQTTLEIVRASLKGDQTVTPAERERLIKLWKDGKQHAPPINAAPVKPGIIRRKEAAKRLGRKTRTIDDWCRQGILKRVTVPGKKQSSGILESSVDALLQAGE